MPELPGSSDDGPPALRLRVGLRWKAFAVLLLLLGLVHAFFGMYLFRQSVDSYRRDDSGRLDASRRVFDGLQQQAIQNLARLAAQIAASTSAADAAELSRSGNRLSPELLADLSALQILDVQSRDAAWLKLVNSAELPAAIESRLQESVRHSHRPVPALWCQEECTLFVYAPAFDRDGREVLVGTGQPATEMLLAFSRQTGTDIALLSDSTAGPSRDTLLNSRLFAITHAPSLLPRLHAATRGLAAPPIDRSFAANSGDTSLLLLLSPLSLGKDGRVYALFMIDESPMLQRIQASLRNGLAISLGGLLLSSAMLWWFLTPLSRRLRVVTRALPLLAEKRFSDAQDMLKRVDQQPRLPDEIDLLTANTRWLTQRLERLDSAEAASAAKSRFLATMSHEVRTPLNGILGMLEVLQHSSLDAGQHDSLRMVHESAQSLLRVLDDTLDLARIEAGRIDLDLAPFSIEQVFDGCAETMAARARSKGLKLVAHVDPALPRQVVGDAMRLRQVLGNLCSNAVKFTEVGRVVVRAESDGRIESAVRVRFSVSDTGIGIPEAIQRVLFQPFQQGGGSTAARYGGSGLGLSICQGLVERMGGQIGFVSRAGNGTEFSFWLLFPVAAVLEENPSINLENTPVDVQIDEADERAWMVSDLVAAGARIVPGAELKLRQDGKLGLVVEGGSSPAQRLSYPLHRCALLRAVAQAAGLNLPPRQPVLPAAPARPLRVLAVDDHPTNRILIQKQLSLLGHEAVTATSGAEALDALGLSRYDLVITDLRMPDMDGIGLVREIRRREGIGDLAGHLPVMLLTAQVEAGAADRFRTEGIDDYLAKPIALERLRGALLPWTGEGPESARLTPASAAGDGDRMVIDRAAVVQLLGGNEEAADQLLDGFVQINTPCIAKLADLARRHEWDAVAEMAHRLLGSARTAAAQPLAQALTALESAARHGKPQDFAELIRSVAVEFERVRDWLDSDQRLNQA